MVFFLAIGVRLLHLQDLQATVDRGSSLTALLKPYKVESQRMLDEGGIIFPREHRDATDARIALHPPGYSILILALSRGKPLDLSVLALQWLQIIGDAIAALLVMFIAVEMFPRVVAILAGTLVALSPHLALYSAQLSPDTLVSLPVLLAIYLMIRASKRPRLITIIAAGCCIGVSLWMRSNTLLFAPFLCLVFPLLFERGKRLRYGLVLVAATALMISPMTLRNWLVLHHFVPSTIHAGLVLIEGLGDYDTEGRFDMPATDGEALEKENEWYARNDVSLWSPDGIERDRARFGRGVAVIRSNPLWFSGVMLRRAMFMLRYSDWHMPGRTYITSAAPPLSKEPVFNHDLDAANQRQLVWSNSAAELFAGGRTLSNQSAASLTGVNSTLEITGDDTDFGEQFAFAPLDVKPNTDYLLNLFINSEQGNTAVKVTVADRAVALISDGIPIEWRTAGPKKKDKLSKRKTQDSYDEPKANVVDLPFATNNRTSVVVVLSKNGKDVEKPVVNITQAQLWELGATPNRWTHFPRSIIRGIQKTLFTTKAMWTLIIAGILLIALAKGKQVPAVLLVVPAYYLCFQSAVHTEYRYILPIHYFFFIIAAVALYVLLLSVKQLGYPVVRRLTPARSVARESGSA